MHYTSFYLEMDSMSNKINPWKAQKLYEGNNSELTIRVVLAFTQEITEICWHHQFASMEEIIYWCFAFSIVSVLPVPAFT